MKWHSNEKNAEYKTRLMICKKATKKPIFYELSVELVEKVTFKVQSSKSGS